MGCIILLLFVGVFHVVRTCAFPTNRQLLMFGLSENIKLLTTDLQWQIGSFYVLHGEDVIMIG
jgi:hypothetical protein